MNDSSFQDSDSSTKASAVPSAPSSPERKDKASLKSFIGRRFSFGAQPQRPPRFEVSTTQLGSGTYGSVMLGTDLTTGEPVAIKFISSGRMKPASLDREVSILQQLTEKSLPGICGMRAHLRPSEVALGDIRAEGGESLPKQLRSCYAIVMDAARGGELFEYVVQRDGLDESESGPLFTQLLAAVRSAHDLGIAHRDLKLENVLLRGCQGEPDADKIRLIDWGLAHQYRLASDGSVVLEALHSRCGSPSYMAVRAQGLESCGDCACNLPAIAMLCHFANQEEVGSIHSPTARGLQRGDLVD
jgi:hypothetical protein